MTEAQYPVPVCPTEELSEICAQAQALAQARRHAPAHPACERLANLASMDVREIQNENKGEDTCASTKTWLSCNPQHVMKNTVETTIPPLLYSCDRDERSQTADALSSTSPSKCRYVSPMPEAKFARGQQQRAYALLEEMRELMKQCDAHGVSYPARLR